MSKQAFLVDDSKSARIVLSRMLKQSGFDSVEMAESGEQALELLKELSPDAIFVDFLMDGIDGLETIKQIRLDPRFQATPIVMCTANEGDEYVKAAVDHGALGILVKPPTEQSLGEIIQIMDRHRQEQMEAAAPVAEPAPVEAETELSQPTVESAPVVSAALSEQAVREIAQQAVDQGAAEAARQAVAQAVDEALEKSFETRLEGALDRYFAERLEPRVQELVQRELTQLAPAEVDTDAIEERVVTRVNQDLEDSIRQINRRELEELIHADVFAQISKVEEDLTEQMKDQEARILTQVPEKNDMIEHIRVVTEGSLEAHVHETATQVAQEVSNSVATETVEHMLEQHLARQSLEEPKESGNKVIWMLLLVLILASAGGAYYLL
ncbi:MAG: response regulator [Candidatus Thiodiazotropha sp.]